VYTRVRTILSCVHVVDSIRRNKGSHRTDAPGRTLRYTLLHAAWRAQLPRRTSSHALEHEECISDDRGVAAPRAGPRAGLARAAHSRSSRRPSSPSSQPGARRRAAARSAPLGWSGCGVWLQLVKGEIHRVDPEFGSTVTVSSRDSQSNCWVNWKKWVNPVNFRFERHAGIWPPAAGWRTKMQL
jgi:hypothetical protein